MELKAYWRRDAEIPRMQPWIPVIATLFGVIVAGLMSLCQEEIRYRRQRAKDRSDSQMAVLLEVQDLLSPAYLDLRLVQKEVKKYASGEQSGISQELSVPFITRAFRVSSLSSRIYDDEARDLSNRAANAMILEALSSLTSTETEDEEPENDEEPKEEVAFDELSGRYSDRVRELLKSM